MSRKKPEPSGRWLTEAEVEIMCIGIDNLQHTCLPHSDVCKCGVPVRRKKLMRDDYQLLSCYECTY